ncbi:CidA/LrgA family protein [Schinkia azotoformans]|uniref:Putative murein hydrolase exporter, LrgA n=1 Tax=Schinkia azotoformans LMG 9581 TaxID=1131731 RepID=K6D3P1_SCHAZ|nr:CidA/LrgA family protein [Schinkia azotoformans]EKN62879.1 putative murein hydrolase exporter, LrgA [Schinkia azotoformans LMG 9581]MEC1641072.1 CidA/LrgA family protein [Schinkia azotoformans]MEC1945086.1 CidA/LrgA family protein [Schinkia azotoformans]
MGGYIRIFYQIGILYVFYYIGLWIQQTFKLLMPGSIIGMLLLFCLLMTKKFKVTWIDKGASFLLSHLPLLFIPVTVGIIDYFELFKGRGFLSVIVVIISTILVMITSSFVAGWIAEKNINAVKMRTQEGKEI